MRFVSVVSVVALVALVSVVALCSLVQQKWSFAGNASHSRNGLLSMHQAVGAREMRKEVKCWARNSFNGLQHRLYISRRLGLEQFPR